MRSEFEFTYDLDSSLMCSCYRLPRATAVYCSLQYESQRAAWKPPLLQQQQQQYAAADASNSCFTSSEQGSPAASLHSDNEAKRSGSSSGASAEAAQCTLLLGVLKRAHAMLLSKIALASDLQEKGSNTSRSGLVSISDFELLKPISEGGSAKVFLARKKRTGETPTLHHCCNMWLLCLRASVL
jgi:hypothetical protein